MKITVNGNSHTFPDDMTISQLIDRFALEPGSVVVEQNMEIVPQERFAGTPLKEGDRLELIRFVGGG